MARERDATRLTDAPMRPPMVSTTRLARFGGYTIVNPSGKVFCYALRKARGMETASAA
jgi:hypothetical protein